MIWFTSDLHLGHANAIRHARRPWDDIDEMNAALIESINERVQIDDELYILGDYSFKIPVEDAAALRARIRCRKVHLLKGNHDRDWSAPGLEGVFILDQPITQLKVDGQRIAMSHYPIADWAGMRHGAWHLHGHIHSGGPVDGHASYNELNRAQGLLRYDVGVDANGYAPVSLEELRRWFEGAAPSGRRRWWDWVGGTPDEGVAAECAAYREMAARDL